MRTLSMAVLLTPALLAAAPALAQVWSPGPGSSYPVPAQQIPPPPMVSANPPSYDPSSGPAGWSPGPVYYDQSGAPLPPAQQPQAWGYNHPGQGGSRWGGTVGGRWYGGSQAPGGWGAYRRPSRGWTLPGYWMGGGFRIPDHHAYGLSAPPAGYFWVRYYDDAVLVNAQGRVRDWTDGIAWGGGGAAAGAWSSSQSYSNVTVGGRPIQTVDPNSYYYHPQGGYVPPAAPPPPAVQVQSYPACASPCAGYGGYYGGSQYAGGYYYGAPSVTTIVIQSAPMVTTTVIEEEVIEEVVTTTYVAAPRKAVRRAPVRKWRPQPKPSQCACQCVCK